MKINYRNIIITLLIVHLVALSLFAAFRIIDADEGMFGNLARMIGEHKMPYKDFFWSQLILMPTLFSHFADGGWSSLFVLRGFGVLSGILSAVIFMLIIKNLTRNNKITALMLFMYTFSGMSLVWHSTFKMITFCHFLALAAFYLWMKYSERQSILYLFMAGFFLSVLINFRSLFVILLPVYLISVYLMSDKNRGRALAVMIVSMIPPAIPNLIAALSSWENFIYGNLFFQLTRDVNRSFGDIIMNRLMTYFRAVIDPHLLLIFILAIVSAVLLYKREMIKGWKELFIKPEGVALLNLVLIFLVYMIPHPIARRYIDNYLAFALIIIAVNIEFIWNILRMAISPKVRKIVVSVVAAGYVLSLIPYISIFILGSRDFDHKYTIPEVRAITAHMLEAAGKNDTVLADWPGYTFLSGQVPLKYTEIVGWDFLLPLKHEEYIKYNLCDKVYLNDAISKKIPKLVVSINDAPDYYAEALMENYDRSFQSGNVSVYKRK